MVILAGFLALTSVHSSAREQWEGFVNKGLVGVGRIRAAQFDRAGATEDTLGGLFSGMWFDVPSWRRSGTALTGLTFSGTLYALADRGFGDGTRDFRARMHRFEIAITPFYGPGPASHDQIVLTHKNTTLFTYDGTHFTGFDAGGPSRTGFPHSPPSSPGGGRRALDSEGLAVLPGNRFFVSDEYGPCIYVFNAAGELLSAISPPNALVPKRGAYPGRTDFTATTPPDSGRRDNRGFEGLTQIPGEDRIAAILQSPVMQDSSAESYGRLTRLLQFDATHHSSRFGRLLSEYIYPLTEKSNASTSDYTVVSELLAVGRSTFLVLERDSLGLGADSAGSPRYKWVVLASTAGATSIANTGYDLEKGARGQQSLATFHPPGEVRPMVRRDWIDLLDPHQLARFGLNANATPDRNTISEKWEGLALVPLNDPDQPDDQLLLVGNDNDFKAPLVYHNGQIVGTNAIAVDPMILAYRVTLPKR